MPIQRFALVLHERSLHTSGVLAIFRSVYLGQQGRLAETVRA
jgi:hypothetical protein